MDYLFSYTILIDETHSGVNDTLEVWRETLESKVSAEVGLCVVPGMQV